MGTRDFSDEFATDSDVREDGELYRQLYADLQRELAEEHERHAKTAWDAAHVAYGRDDPATAIRCMREALRAAVQARLCRERAAESMRELHALIQMLAQEFAESEPTDSASGIEVEAEAGADDHQAQSPSL